MLDACISITRGSGRGLGPGILEFFGPCEMASIGACHLGPEDSHTAVADSLSRGLIEAEILLLSSVSFYSLDWELRRQALILGLSKKVVY